MAAFLPFFASYSFFQCCAVDDWSSKAVWEENILLHMMIYWNIFFIASVTLLQSLWKAGIAELSFKTPVQSV